MFALFRNPRPNVSDVLSVSADKFPFSRCERQKGVCSMLVLTRKLGEEIVIPSLDVTLRVVEVRGEKVRLGIQAPTQVAVHRKEVWDRIHEFGSVDPVDVEG
jgi:carbon storage regulator